jgi:hypothetical protein
MSALEEFKLKALQDFREGILAIKKQDLTPERLMKYFEENAAKVRLFGASLNNPLGQFLSSLSEAKDIDVLNAARDHAVSMVDSHIAGIKIEAVRPVLEEHILRVQDTKLATLLKEFNAIKDSQPNIAAIGLRTILCLIIVEKAKDIDPESGLAKTTDLKLSPLLKGAIDQKIFAEGETKLLKAFQQQGLKETFDNIVHKPGTNALISKDDLSSLVQNTVNRLLADLVS